MSQHDTADNAERGTEPERFAVEFRQAITAMWHQARRSLTAGQPGMTMARLEVLFALAESGPLSIGEVATKTGSHPSSLTRVVAGLEDRDLVRRYMDRRDRRSHILEITDLGRAEFYQSRALLDRAFSRVFDRLSAEERTHLIAALPLIERIAESMGET